MPDLARRPDPAPAVVDWDAALRYLGLNPRDPKAVALMAVCDRYGFDPLLGHVSIYEGKPYVHYSAYLYKANSNPHYAGSECMREWEDDEWYYATVRVHRDDRDFPAERTGRSRKIKRKKDGTTYRDDTADAKAFAQAHRRALRLAFNVAVPEPDDHGDGPTPAPEPVVEVARMVDEMSGPGVGPPSPGSDPTSGAGEADTTVSLSVPTPDPTSPPPDGQEGMPGPGRGGDPKSHWHERYEDGDALPDDDGEGPDGHGDPTPAIPGQGEMNGMDATVGPTPPDDPNPSPVQAWADSHGYDIRLLRIHLKRTYPAEFWDLKDRVDLQLLRGDRAAKAIAYLEAAFLPGEVEE